MYKPLFFLLTTVLAIACNSKELIVRKPILDKNRIKIGDSIFNNKNLVKIIFTDTTLIVDSIVYKRFNISTNKIKSISTFIKGKRVFENIEYHENGKIKEYRFIDEDSDTYFYSRIYDTSGHFLDKQGKLFFQIYLHDTSNLEGLAIKEGSNLFINVFYPNPPDLKSFLFVRFSDNKKIDVFSENKIMNCLKSVYTENTLKDKSVNWREINIGLELSEVDGNIIDTFGKKVFYKVVANSN